MRKGGLPGHWVRVENRVGRGTPDVNYCLPEGTEGWLELKSLGRFPANSDHEFRIRHFTRQQRFWIRARVRVGGVVAVLLRVERGPREYLLLPGAWAAEHVGNVSAGEARAAATATWGPAWDRGALLEGLRRMG